MKSLPNAVRCAARWLVAFALVFHIAWLPVHLLTTAHCNAGPAHDHAQAHADHHGHSHGPVDPTDHGDDADHRHYASDHESKFLSKRQSLLFAPALVTWQVTVLTPAQSEACELPANAGPAPPPADSPPPSGPRAPPLA